ncbi:N66 matrix protein-like [Diaphorina citri]|uniref:N66 matrix protein-like n=1 Tax=Diaphorina citri TaxID=121845 RepID=A0A3Q0JJZ4_DIACI|nr:N66 matrix protein-like [Diaphorina citri]
MLIWDMVAAKAIRLAIKDTLPAKDFRPARAIMPLAMQTASNIRTTRLIKSLNSKLNNQQGTAPSNKLGNINSGVTSNANLGYGSSQGNTIGNQGHPTQGLPASQGNNAFGNANSFKHPNNQSNSNSYGSPNGQTNSYGGPNNNANNGNRTRNLRRARPLGHGGSDWYY